MICPKCGYKRKAKEAVGDDQCPSCGVYYAKVQNADPFLPKAVIYAEPKRSFPFGKLLLAVLVAGAAWASAPYLRWKSQDTESALRGQLVAPDGRTLVRDLDLRPANITMYSLTTCVYCRELRHIFEANQVPFREYFVDADEARMKELFAKLEMAGYKGGGFGTPTLEVNGVMLPNNPPLEEILKTATGGVYRRRT